ncbi:nuclear transport factor 2 family protein [Pendulispora brunnea]|uniref:Nuclear transport factor 2 family protein n=1 Tax=Pendulispora brunnea TaxID=2905690 RepID=A0ABZ2KLP8_9BACT
MESNENKRLLQHVYAELAKGNSRPLVESLADDVRWTVPGTTKWSKTYVGKESVLRDLLAPLRAKFATPYKATATRFIAEGDCVVVEARGDVMTKSNMPYNNAYCFVYRFAEGKVRELVEYADTELVTSALGDPTEASPPG